MAQAKKTILETIKAYSSTIPSVFSALVILYSAFTFVSQGNQTAKSNRELTQVVTELKKTVETLQDTNAVQHSRIMESLQETQEEILEIKDNDNKWHKSYVEFVKDNTTNSVKLFRYLEGLDLSFKKAVEIKQVQDYEAKIRISKQPKQ